MSGRVAEILCCCLLCIAIVATGVWLVTAKYESRQLFAELEALNREQDRLEIDWGRLRLEQSTYATHPRIESIAREQLQLRMPQPTQLVVVAEPR
jgi:cell division protein FtsL